MENCKGCKTDEGLRFSFDGDPLCKFCVVVAGNVVQVLENDHSPDVPRGTGCTACEYMRECGCGTCVGFLTARIRNIFGEVPERVTALMKTAPSSAV